MTLVPLTVRSTVPAGRVRLVVVLPEQRRAGTESVPEQRRPGTEAVPEPRRPGTASASRPDPPPSLDRPAPARPARPPRRRRRVVVPLLRLGLLLGVVAVCTTGPPPRPVSPVGPAAPVAAPTRKPARAAPPPDPSATVAALVGRASSGHVSIAAVDLATGRSFGAEPDASVHTASVVKLDVLETLLLQAQDDGRKLTSSEDQLATTMIENSDNDAATALWGEVGGAAGLSAANARLGLHHTWLDDGEWGTSTTTAADQVALVADLARPGALGPGARAYARDLLAQVEDDQQWGVSAAADPGAPTELKNGWLPLDDDSGYWIVGSVGLTTVGGDPVALAVLAEHQPSEQSGIALDEALARTAAEAVVSRPASVAPGQ